MKLAPALPTLQFKIFTGRLNYSESRVMQEKTIIKCLCLFVYISLIVCVPGMPSYYTFCINFLGFMLSTAASLLLIQFLNSRPVPQKNMLNRILVLGVTILLLGTTEHFIMSIAACFFPFQLNQLVDTYPMLSIFFLSSRNVAILCLTAMCCLSAGRLLLFTKPIIFIRVNTYTGWFCTGSIGLVLLTADHLYRWIACTKDELQQMMLMQVFRMKLGLPKYTNKNYTTASKQTNICRQMEAKEDDHQCSDIPSLKILSACFLFLELSKLVFILAKEYIKNRKTAQISPAAENELANIKPTNLKEKICITRAESFPKSFEPKIRKERRISLQFPGTLNLKKDKISSTMSLNPAPIPLPTVQENRNIYLKRIIKQLCLRSSSLITIFIIIGLATLINGSITQTQGESVQFGVAAFIITERLMMYVLVVLLSVFDLDVVLYFKEKFDLPNL